MEGGVVSLVKKKSIPRLNEDPIHGYIGAICAHLSREGIDPSVFQYLTNFEICVFYERVVLGLTQGETGKRWNVTHQKIAVIEGNARRKITRRIF